LRCTSVNYLRTSLQTLADDGPIVKVGNNIVSTNTYAVSAQTVAASLEGGV